MKGLPLKPLFASIAVIFALNACSMSTVSQTTNDPTPLTAAQIEQQHADNPFFKPYGTFLIFPHQDVCNMRMVIGMDCAILTMTQHKLL